MKTRPAARLKQDEGFTLIELMVVVLIIGILVAIAVPKFLNAQTGAKSKAAQSNARSAEAVMQSAVTDKGSSYTIDPVAGAAWAALKAADPMFVVNEGVASSGPSIISWQRMNGAAAATAAQITAGTVTGIQIAVLGKDNTCYVIDNSTTAGTTYGEAKASSATACKAGAAGLPATATAATGSPLVADVAAGWA